MFAAGREVADACFTTFAEEVLWAALAVDREVFVLAEVALALVFGDGVDVLVTVALCAAGLEIAWGAGAAGVGDVDTGICPRNCAPAGSSWAAVGLERDKANIIKSMKKKVRMAPRPTRGVAGGSRGVWGAPCFWSAKSVAGKTRFLIERSLASALRAQQTPCRAGLFFGYQKPWEEMS